MKDVCIVVGMPRAATTYLYQTLASHPQAFVPARKELEYYSINFARGAAWYESFYSDRGDHQIGFDISPIYFFSDEALSRISELDADTKVILILRKPSEFVMSWYKNRLIGDHNCPPFEQFIQGHTYVKDGVTLNIDIRPGQIPDRIQRFVDLLGDRLLVLDFDDINKAPVATMQRIEQFVGLNTFFNEATLSTDKVNASNQQPNRVLAYLTHQKWFADAVTKLFPRDLILQVRKRVQSTARSKPVLDPASEEQYQQLTDQLYACDDRSVSALLETTGR